MGGWRSDIMDPTQAIHHLADGNGRHARGTYIHPHQSPQRRTDLASGQRPWAAVLGCSDSRVPPEIVFDQGLGDLFVVRTAGHVCDATATASLGYAIQHLHVPQVIVLGHSGCGAVNAAIAHRLDESDDCLYAAIRPAIERACRCEGDMCDLTVRFHVQETVEFLRQALPALRNGEVAVVGAVYDLASGRVEFLPVAEAAGESDGERPTPPERT
jgi:carbonic anhydrase